MSLLLSSSLFLKRIPVPVASNVCRLALLPSSSLSLFHTRAQRTSISAGDVVNSLSQRYYTTTTPQSKHNTTTDQNTSSSTKKTNAQYTFNTGVCSIPHPAKAKKGGEDAHFTSSDHKVIAVADGVGGWSESGIDPAEYSRALMKGAKDFCENNIQNGKPHDPRAIMRAGWQHACNIIGSSTCCICVIDGATLKAANLGDSGFTIIRDGKVFFSSPSQQHGFNFPYQLGPQSSDKPEVSEMFEKRVEIGDVIVAATDGVFDNISPDAIAALVDPANAPDQIAAKIGQLARRHAIKTTGTTPFSIAAEKSGYMYNGGKLDDITVVVGVVSE